jgi:hypothetical protein
LTAVLLLEASDRLAKRSINLSGFHTQQAVRKYYFGINANVPAAGSKAAYRTGTKKDK